MTKKSIISILISCSVIIGGCSFVKLNPDANNTVIINNLDLANDCKLIGNINTSIWSSAETFQSKAKIESQLDTLARNDATKMGGNAIFPTSAIESSSRSYNVYNCPKSNN